MYRFVTLAARATLARPSDVRGVAVLRTPCRGMSTVRTPLAPFPDDVPTHPLVVIDYAALKRGDEAEASRLWSAATRLGFCLKNHETDNEVEGMFEMGAETMRLPVEEKMKYEQGDVGSSFGYKAAGANATDEYGNPDLIEFINIAKDDALAWPQRAHRDYPSTVNERMSNTIAPFVRKALDVNNTLLEVFNTKLGLPHGVVARRHLLEEHSGSEARTILKQPSSTPEDDARPIAAIGGHTDFGSLSFLHNRLGGLQVLVPGTNDWQYIKPLPNHAICNIGDAMAIFSGGILRSNMHRVVSPPGEQAQYDRWSQVFFTRPGNSVLLNALTDESAMIAAAVDAAPDRRERFITGQTAKEWFTRRIRNQRMKNRTGPETWKASRGTEHRPDLT